MGRHFRPKKKVRCPNCGWEGVRVDLLKYCPKCTYWKPVEVREVNKSKPNWIEACRQSGKDIRKDDDETT